MEGRVVVFLLSHQPPSKQCHTGSYLEETVDDLTPHIFLMATEQLALQQAIDTFGNAVLGLEVLGCSKSVTGHARVQ